MTVVHAGRNEWTVYSGTTGEYTISIQNGEWSCTCPDAEHNLSDGEQCKHARRTRMEIGDMPIPDLGKRTDVEIMQDARNRRATTNAVATDGGMVLEAQPQGSEAENGCPHEHPDCEGVDADTERPVLCFDCWEVWASA